VLFRLLCADGLLTPTVMVAALLLTAAGLVVEGLLWRGLIDLGRDLGLTGQRLGAMGMVLVFGTALLLLELGITGVSCAPDGSSKCALRMAFLAKLRALTPAISTAASPGDGRAQPQPAPDTAPARAGWAVSPGEL
jgi:hypothetical protein